MNLELKDHYCKEFPYQDVLKWVRLTGDGGPTLSTGNAFGQHVAKTRKTWLFNENETLSFVSMEEASRFLGYKSDTIQTWIRKQGHTNTTPMYYILREDA